MVVGAGSAGCVLARRLTAEPDLDVLLLEAGPPDEKEAIAEHVRETAQTIYLPVGTCKMGSDDLAVVDDRLQVHGLDGLRVVDTSIVPTVPGGNTNAPTIAVAEKGADPILDDR